MLKRAIKKQLKSYKVKWEPHWILEQIGMQKEQRFMLSMPEKPEIQMNINSGPKITRTMVILYESNTED